MGTNYYVHENVCEHCERSDEPLHIGKSSAGWVFALRQHRERGLDDLGDWIRYISSNSEKIEIRNEYGDPVSLNDLLGTILLRYREGGLQGRFTHGLTYTLEPGEFS